MHEAFLEEIRAQLGEQTDAFLKEMERPYAASLRLNPFRPGSETLCVSYTDGQVDWCPDGRYIRPGTRPGLSPLQFAGAYYIQEASAMAPAVALNVRPGERVLDLCAAPGGKSGQLAAALQGEGLLVANEPEPARAKILSATLERLGVVNAIVTNALPEKLSPLLPGYFDAVLVDAPCSGEGMFRRDPASREQWTPASPAGCAARQAGILDHAARMLRPGGRLAYSTCTFNRAENEETIAAFLSRHPEFTPVAFELNGVGASRDGCLRLWPHRLRGEGHFVALLRKEGEDRPAMPPTARPAKPDKEVREALRMLTQAVPGMEKTLSGGEVVRAGEYLRLPPRFAPALPGVRVLREGLHLCRMGRGYVEPDHALAMALQPEQAAQTRALSPEETRRVLAGETVPGDMRGWTLLTLQGLPLGWGKASGGVVKNHIPKGLRLNDRQDLSARIGP